MRFCVRLAMCFLCLGLAGPVGAQSAGTNAPAVNATTPVPTSELARLSQSNRELLDLLKKQQGVLQDIQYDRRLQNRQLQLVEEKLTDALQRNATLQAEIARLKAEAAARPATPAPVLAATNAPGAAAPPATTPDHPPVSYLPPAPDVPGGKGWHRLFTTNGTESTKTEVFQISTRRWRVVWHNQDKPGAAFLNTSALFINAFPKDDTIPQKVCSKLGSGGDFANLNGPGSYYLKIEASGGSWEIAVEVLQ